MVLNTTRPACPHCASDELRFLEHGAGVTVFQCGDCGRSTVERWAPAVAASAPRVDAFVFPTWLPDVAVTVAVDVESRAQLDAAIGSMWKDWIPVTMRARPHRTAKS